MPAAICHKLHAEKVLESISAGNVEINENAFFWGAQGPDFFFCHRFLPWMRGNDMREIGNEIHASDPDLLLGEMYRICAEKNDPVLLSYLYGFICHYSYDSTAHPYINSRAETMSASAGIKDDVSILHNEIESCLDTFLLRSEKEQLPSEFNLKKAFPKDIVVMKKIASLWHELLKLSIKKDVPTETVYQAECDSIKVFSLLNDKTAIKKNLISKFESGKAHTISCHIRPFFEDQEPDYANMNHSAWGTEGRNEDFIELTEKAKEKAIKIIDGINKTEIKLLTKSEPFG